MTGATVHFVDAGTDTGPIVAQAAVPVHPGDEAPTPYAARILPVEHTLYAAAGPPRARGRVVDLRPAGDPFPGS